MSRDEVLSVSPSESPDTSGRTSMGNPGLHNSNGVLEPHSSTLTTTTEVTIMPPRMKVSNAHLGYPEHFKSLGGAVISRDAEMKLLKKRLSSHLKYC